MQHQEKIQTRRQTPQEKYEELTRFEANIYAEKNLTARLVAMNPRRMEIEELDNLVMLGKILTGIDNSENMLVVLYRRHYKLRGELEALCGKGGEAMTGLDPLSRMVISNYDKGTDFTKESNRLQEKPFNIEQKEKRDAEKSERERLEREEQEKEDEEEPDTGQPEEQNLSLGKITVGEKPNKNGKEK